MGLYNEVLLSCQVALICRPMFERNSYSVNSIPEDIAPGSSIITVTAIDLDLGVNGKVCI